MNYKTLKRKLRESEALFESAVKELQQRNMQIDLLYDTLDKVKSTTTDNLAKEISSLGMRTHQVDKLIHARSLFK